VQRASTGRNIDGLIAGHGKGNLKCFISNPKSAIDVVRQELLNDFSSWTDFLIDLTLQELNLMNIFDYFADTSWHGCQCYYRGQLAMVAHADQKTSGIIYHVGSSLRNPVKLTNLHDFNFRYFRKNPWINRKGARVKVKKNGHFN